MNETMITWMAVVAIVLLAFLFRAIEKFRLESHASSSSHFHCLELSNEEEEFFCPGDNEWYECEDL